MSFTNFDQSTFLAFRAIDAVDLGDPPPPQMVALPGAKAAIEHDRLLAHHEAKHDQQTIVDRVNERYERENADRLAEHKRWAAGPYRDAIEEMRKRAIQAAAEEQRRKAIFEEIVRERENG